MLKRHASPDKTASYGGEVSAFLLHSTSLLLIECGHVIYMVSLAKEMERSTPLATEPRQNRLGLSFMVSPCRTDALMAALLASSQDDAERHLPIHF